MQTFSVVVSFCFAWFRLIVTSNRIIGQRIWFVSLWKLGKKEYCLDSLTYVERAGERARSRTRSHLHPNECREAKLKQNAHFDIFFSVNLYRCISFNVYCLAEIRHRHCSFKIALEHSIAHAGLVKQSNQFWFTSRRQWHSRIHFSLRKIDLFFGHEWLLSYTFYVCIFALCLVDSRLWEFFALNYVTIWEIMSTFGKLIELTVSTVLFMFFGGFRRLHKCNSSIGFIN